MTANGEATDSKKKITSSDDVLKVLVDWLCIQPQYENVARLFSGAKAVHLGSILMTRVDYANSRISIKKFRSQFQMIQLQSNKPMIGFLRKISKGTNKFDLNDLKPSKNYLWLMNMRLGMKRRFVPLSDSCVPLYNFSYIYNCLMGSSKSFVDSRRFCALTIDFGEFNAFDPFSYSNLIEFSFMALACLVQNVLLQLVSAWE